MESVKYEKLVEEVYSLLDIERLRVVLSERCSATRVDGVQDMLRGSILSSSISKFNGSPYFFGGRIYEEMSWDDFGNMIYDIMRRCGLPNGDYSRMENIIRVCRRVVSLKELHPDNGIIIFNNCVLEVSSRAVHSFGREWVQVTAVPYDYEPDNFVFLWSQFLDEVLPDKEMQYILQEFLGSVFIDRRMVKIETMLVLLGSGSNGKSVIFETVTGILGRINVSNFGISALSSGYERKKNIASINGKRLNYCSEIQALEFGKESDTLKALISGEPVEARPMYGDNFTAYNIPLLMANANRMPRIRDWSYGMRRRIVIIPFEVEVPVQRQRRTFARDLEPEYPAILNWMLDGRDRFMRNGCQLTECRRIEALLDEYQAESSTVLEYMYKQGYACRFNDVIGCEPKWMRASILYRNYARWCMDNDKERETLARFGRILVEAGYKKKRIGVGLVYAIYGKAAVSLLMTRRRRETDIKTYKRRIAVPQVDENGKRWARTVDGLAYCLNISTNAAQKLFQTGRLEGMYRMEGRARLFDLEQAEKLVKSMKYGTRTTRKGTPALNASRLKEREEREKREAAAKKRKLSRKRKA